MPSNQFWHDLGKLVGDVVRSLAGSSTQATKPRTTKSSSGLKAPVGTSAYAGDYVGLPVIEYAPHSSSLPDPGEIAWGWVPYEEDYSQGKDRPVLIIGRDGPWLLGLPLSSVDHRVDTLQEARVGRFWIPIGKGNWDSQGRASEVRVDRIVRFSPDGMRRVAGSLDKQRYQAVAEGLRKHWND